MPSPRSKSAANISGNSESLCNWLVTIGLERFILVQEAVLVFDSKAEAAEMILAHGVAQVDVLRAVHIEELGARPDHEHLADLLLERHLLQRFLRPLLSGFIEMDRAWLLKDGLRGAEYGQ